MLMAFRNEKGKWALKKIEISPISRFWILTAQNYFWNQKKPLEGKILNYSGKNIHK